MPYWNRVRGSIIGEATKFLEEAHGRGLAFKGVNEKVIKNVECEGSSRTRYTCRKQSCLE
jgi:hypothetical protein